MTGADGFSLHCCDSYVDGQWCQSYRACTSALAPRTCNTIITSYLPKILVPGTADTLLDFRAAKYDSTGIGDHIYESRHANTKSVCVTSCTSSTALRLR